MSRAPRGTGQGRLSSAMGNAAASKMDTEAVKARGWRENGILVVSALDPRLDETDQAAVRRLGKKLYGGG